AAAAPISGFQARAPARANGSKARTCGFSAPATANIRPASQGRGLVQASAPATRPKINNEVCPTTIESAATGSARPSAINPAFFDSFSAPQAPAAVVETPQTAAAGA